MATWSASCRYEPHQIVSKIPIFPHADLGDLGTQKVKFGSKMAIFGVIWGLLGRIGNQPPHPPIFGKVFFVAPHTRNEETLLPQIPLIQEFAASICCLLQIRKIRKRADWLGHLSITKWTWGPSLCTFGTKFCCATPQAPFRYKWVNAQKWKLKGIHEYKSD